MISVQAELISTRLRAESNTLSHALDAQQRGWSVIPLLGGQHPLYGKRPPIEWKKYQTLQPTEQQIKTWFTEGYTAYGVVCGNLSNLIAIDFDDGEIQAEFIQKYPHLLETYVVQSGLRKTLHIYLAMDFPVQTCKLRGGDLKAEGSYVVGAGSQIAGGIWQVVNHAPLYAISQAELDKFLSEFGIQQTVSSELSKLAHDAKSPDDFVRIYQFLVNELDSRNEALFRTGCYMRDEGYSVADVIAVLAPVHAHQQPSHQHKAETYSQRYAEVQRTLQSVFSKPPRPKRQQPSKRYNASYIPNALREAILQEAGGRAFLRVYEGLLLSGKSAGDTVTEREVLEFLSLYGVCRPSVRRALKFAISPTLRNPPHAVADLAVATATTKTCVFVQTTTGDKTIGRPAQRYIIPDVSLLCKVMRIDTIASDPITLEAIHSSATYSAALNRELIKRRPGKYSQSWLGNRLNMSERTLQRYLKRENIQSRQLLEETRIDWSNLNQIPTKYGAKRAGFDMQPYFLQDEQGNRYPPKPEIAKKLLKQKHGVWLMKRSVKMYWYGTEPVPKTQMQLEVKSEPIEKVFMKPDYPVLDAMIIPMQIMPTQLDVPVSQIEPFPKNAVNPKPQKQSDKQPKRSVRFYKQPLQEVEARQLVDKYGHKAVGQALGRMEFMRAKGDLQNPAGFMKVVSRVCWLSINGFDKARPEYDSPKKQKSRKIAYNLKQDPIWQSESYRQWRLSFADAPIDIWEMSKLKQSLEF